MKYIALIIVIIILVIGYLAYLSNGADIGSAYSDEDYKKDIKSSFDKFKTEVDKLGDLTVLLNELEVKHRTAIDSVQPEHTQILHKLLGGFTNYNNAMNINLTFLPKVSTMVGVVQDNEQIDFNSIKKSNDKLKEVMPKSDVYNKIYKKYNDKFDKLTPTGSSPSVKTTTDVIDEAKVVIKVLLDVANISYKYAEDVVKFTDEIIQVKGL